MIKKYNFIHLACRFALFKTPSSREAAAEVCSSYQKQRGVLAEIQSDEENEEVVTLLAYLKDQVSWKCSIG